MKQILNDYSKRQWIVVLLFAIAIFILLGIAIYKITAVNGKTDTIHELSKEDQAYFASMSDYLDELDQAVVSNQENLDGINLFNTETEGSLTSITSALESLDQLTQTIESALEKYTLVSQKDQVKITESFSSLSSYQKALESQITDSKEVITDILASMESTNSKHYAETMEKVLSLQSYLETTRSTMESYYKDLVSQSESLKKDMDNQSQKLSDELAAYQNNLLVTLQNTSNELQAALDAHSLTLKITLQENYLSLMDQMNTLHQQIGATKNDLAQLLMMMEENSADRHEEIQSLFQTVLDSIGQFQLDFNETQINLQALIADLKETGNANHHEALAVLGVMEQNMNSASTENLNQILNSMTDLQSSFDNTMNTMQEEINQNFTSISNGMTNQFFSLNTTFTDHLSVLNNNMNNQYSSLTTAIDTSDSGLREYVENSMSLLNQQLQQVFTYVSSGKQKLASALLTKGVSCNEDATFSEIYQAILNIPQQLLIGVEQLPGQISYDYHYHEDSDGGFPHVEQLQIIGGCYTVPLYHVHLGSSSSGGGCYTTPVYHSHTSACFSEGNNNDNCPRHTEYHPYDCGTVHDYDGDGHGCDGFTVWDCSGHSYNTCGKGSGLIGYSLGCGKSGSTVDAYGPGCRLSDGQIIAAHIVYDSAALLAAPLSGMGTMSLGNSTVDTMPIAADPIDESTPYNDDTDINQDPISVSGNELIINISSEP